MEASGLPLTPQDPAERRSILCTVSGRIRQAEWPQVKVAALHCLRDSEACQGKSVDFLGPKLVQGRRGQGARTCHDRRLGGLRSLQRAG